MSSSFDELTPEQAAALESTQIEPAISVYESCSRLASHYKQQNLRIRGGAVIRNGEAKAEPLDFLADLELKAKRCLDIRGFAMWQVFNREYETAMQLPRKYQDLLSKEWLGVFYGYEELFRAADRSWKAQEREEQRKAATEAWHTQQVAEPTAEIDAVQLLEDADQPFAANLQ